MSDNNQPVNLSPVQIDDSTEVCIEDSSVFCFQVHFPSVTNLSLIIAFSS